MKPRKIYMMSTLLLAMLASSATVRSEITRELVSTIEDLKTAFENGGYYVLENSLYYSTPLDINITGNVTVDLDFSSNIIDFRQNDCQYKINAGSSVTLSNGTIQGMYSEGTSRAVLLNSGTLTLNEMVINKHTTLSRRGVVHNLGAQDQEAYFYMNGGAIMNSTITYFAYRGLGGAFYNKGGDRHSIFSFAEFNGVSFLNNANHSGFGGAICNGDSFGAASLVLRNCMFDSNTNVEMYAWGEAPGSVVGGGALTNVWGYVTAIDTNFRNNSSDVGGAILNRYYLTIRAEEQDVYFTNNNMTSHRDDQEKNKGPNDIYLHSIFNDYNLALEGPEHANHTFLEASEDRKIVFEGGIRGFNDRVLTDGNGNDILDEVTGNKIYDTVDVINNRVLINQTREGVDYEGTVVFERGAIVETTNMTLYNGTLTVANAEVFYNKRDRVDLVNDRNYLLFRNNFFLEGGTLDLSRFLSGSFSIQTLGLTQGTIWFGQVRENHDEALIIGTRGWADSNTAQIVFYTDCLGSYNKSLNYLLLDYVEENLTLDDLDYFSLSYGHDGEDWVLDIWEGDLVLRYTGENGGGDGGDGGGGECPCPPVEPPAPPLLEREQLVSLTENSLWTTGSNAMTMGRTTLEQLNVLRMKNGPGRNVWAKGLGDFIRQESRQTIDGFNYNGGGYAAGVDHRISERSYAGVSFGQIWGNLKSRDYDSRVKQKSEMATVYGGSLIEVSPERSWLLKGAVTRAYTDNSMSSYFSEKNTSSRGNWENTCWYLQGEISYRIDQGRGWVWAPFAGVEYSYASRNSFVEEEDKGQVKLYGKSRLERLSVPVGLQVDYLGQLGDMPWLNTLKVAYVGDPYRNNPSTSVSYPAGLPVTVNGADPSRNAFRAEYFTLCQLDRHWSAYAGYVFEARSKTIVHQVNAGVSYSF